MQLCTAPQLSIDKLDHIFDWLPPLRIQRTTATNWLEGRHTLYITRTGPSMFVVATNTHQTWLDHIESLAAYREHHFARVFLKCVWCCISVAPEIQFWFTYLTALDFWQTNHRQVYLDSSLYGWRARVYDHKAILALYFSYIYRIYICWWLVERYCFFMYIFIWGILEVTWLQSKPMEPNRIMEMNVGAASAGGIPEWKYYVMQCGDYEIVGR